MLQRGLFISQSDVCWEPHHLTGYTPVDSGFYSEIYSDSDIDSEWSITYFKVHSDNKDRTLFLNDQMDSYNYILTFISQEVF